MLKQVLQQNASKVQAKSNQSQRQIVARRVLVLGMPVETSHHVVTYVPASDRDGMMPLREGSAA